jgi:Flp pilus assembly protein TadG
MIGRGNRSLRSRTQRGAEAGSVAVEYSMTLPFLLCLIYGIVEVSHFAYLKLSVAEVAHDGVRFAVVHSSANPSPETSTQIQTYVTNELNNLGLSQTATVTVTYGSGDTPGSTVQINISYPFTPFMPGFNTVPGTSKKFTDVAGPITATSEMVFSQ